MRAQEPHQIAEEVEVGGWRASHMLDSFFLSVHPSALIHPTTLSLSPSPSSRYNTSTHDDGIDDDYDDDDAAGRCVEELP